MNFKSEDYMRSLVLELKSLPTECEWVEFKVNNKDPQKIGEYISALSNSATLLGRENAYILWGVNDKTHEVEGTFFDYKNSKKGNEELESWLTRLLNPRIEIKFYEVMFGDKKVVVLDISKAQKQPTKFSGEEYIRIGSIKKNLAEYPEKERQLWRAFDSTPAELKIAKSHIDFEEVLKELDYKNYYEKLELALPDSYSKIEDDFIGEKFIKKNDAGRFDITNLGALLLGNDIKKFDELTGKGVRVIHYKDKTKMETINEKRFLKGYVVEFPNIVEYILEKISTEKINGALREKEYSYPPIAIREIIANILIHQDIDQKGTSPMIEIFSDRIEFSNAGIPLVNVERIIDTVPISRNENLAGFMHRCGICEERGSGYDKVMYSLSKVKMLAPKVEIQSDKFTKVTLYSKTPYELITKEDKIRTCYMFACLLYVQGEALDNSVVRELFDIDKHKSSRIIKDVIAHNLVKAVDENTAPRYMKYIPFWA